MSCDVIHARVPPGNYTSPDMIAEYLQAKFKSGYQTIDELRNRAGNVIGHPLTIQYDDIRDRFLLNSQVDAALVSYQDDELGDLLGLAKGLPDAGYVIHDIEHPYLYSERPPQINTSKLIHVYSEIIERERVGSEKVHLLRVVVANSSSKDDVNESWERPMYKRVSKQYINDIDIKVCDDTGDEINFHRGSVSCILHFRKVL
jgi:hypothetical protein